MKKKAVITGLSCLILILAGICYSCAYQKAEADTTITTSLEDNNDDIAPVKSESELPSEAESNNLNGTLDGVSYIFVHVCGAVIEPGVYRVDSGARLVDVIEFAGGLASDADGDYINQAMLLEDGQRIYIPTRDEVISLSEGDNIATEYIAGDNGEKQQDTVQMIDINQADEEELMSLPGIGQAKAGNIIAYRSKNGKFKSIEDLMNIPGIKEGLFQQISSYITVD
ncbi:MAG TPA: helix-hairpin-helix domain-containing protein [Mobilitalea sp.]|nr:helix-hairpin-helix domain-containing protein [Mobilitalea sp.]